MNYLPAEIWNARYVEPLRRCVALPGAYTQVSHIGGGQCVSLTGRALWRHPWFTDVSWNAAEGRWEAVVAAGFVNGEDPLVSGLGVDLVDEPVIPLQAFRGLPSEDEAAPALFAAMGVRKEEDALKITDFGVSVDSTPRDLRLPPPRTLVAMDFYLAVARAAYRPQVAIVDGSGISGQAVDFSVSWDTQVLDLHGSRPRLLQAAKMPKKTVPTLNERLAGAYQDDGEDRQLVSTVYLLSPPDQLDGVPDGRWEPFVAHELFWNVAHASRNAVPDQPKPLRFAGTGLPLADMVVGQWIALDNYLSQMILAAVNTSANEGRFWSV